MPTMMTDYVSTRWYRAPELLLSKQNYSYAVDVWSVGCVFAELFLRQPLFQGSDNENQLDIIINFLGTPSTADIKEMNSDYLNQYLLKIPKRNPIKFEEHFKNADKLSLDLMKKMINFAPSRRPTAEECLSDPLFEELHVDDSEPTAKPISEYEFLFEKGSLTMGEYRSKWVIRVNLSRD